MKSSTPVLDGYRYSGSYTAYERVFSFQRLWEHGLVQECYQAMENIKLVQKCTEHSRLCEYNSYKSAHPVLAPGNSKNNYTPASRPSYGKCETRAKVYRTSKALWMQVRASVHLNTHAREQLTGCYSNLTEKRAHRTGHWTSRLPQLLVEPQLLPTGPDFPKPPFYSCLYPTLCGYPSTRPRLKQKLCALWTVTTQSSNTVQVTLAHLHPVATVR